MFRQTKVGAAERELSAHRDSFSKALGLHSVALICCPNPLPELRAKRWARGNRACKGAEAGESLGSENEEEVRALPCWCTAPGGQRSWEAESYLEPGRAFRRWAAPFIRSPWLQCGV